MVFVCGQVSNGWVEVNLVGNDSIYFDNNLKNPWWRQTHTCTYNSLHHTVPSDFVDVSLNGQICWFLCHLRTKRHSPMIHKRLKIDSVVVGTVLSLYQLYKWDIYGKNERTTRPHSTFNYVSLNEKDLKWATFIVNSYHAFSFFARNSCMFYKQQFHVIFIAIIF